LITFVDDSDECQFTLKDLTDAMGTGDTYTGTTLKNKLKDHYKDSLFVSEAEGKPDIFNFNGSAGALLQEQWYSEKKSSELDERLRIVEKAAEIIREDMRSKNYDCSYYSSLEKNLDDDSILPESLQKFLGVVSATKSGKVNDTLRRRRASIGQALVSACRPRSFISPILLGVGVYAHRNFASRDLVDKLASLSYSVDYSEVKRFVCAQ